MTPTPAPTASDGAIVIVTPTPAPSATPAPTATQSSGTGNGGGEIVVVTPTPTPATTPVPFHSASAPADDQPVGSFFYLAGLITDVANIIIDASGASSRCSRPRAVARRGALAHRLPLTGAERRRRGGDPAPRHTARASGHLRPTPQVVSRIAEIGITKGRRAVHAAPQHLQGSDRAVSAEFCTNNTAVPKCASIHFSRNRIAMRFYADATMAPTNCASGSLSLCRRCWWCRTAATRPPGWPPTDADMPYVVPNWSTGRRPGADRLRCLPDVGQCVPGSSATEKSGSLKDARGIVRRRRPGARRAAPPSPRRSPRLRRRGSGRSRPRSGR